MTTYSPHPATNLRYLLDIQANHYVGRKGKEYVAEEVDALIMDKNQRLADNSTDNSIRERDKAQRELRALVTMVKRSPFLSEGTKLIIANEIRPIVLTIAR